MKKILILLLGMCCVGACATGRIRPCTLHMERPYFFAQEEKLVAFHVEAQWHGQTLPGILQIKKTAEETYQVTLFAALGGMRILQAELTRESAAYQFVLPEADRAAVRQRVERFLRVLLFPALTEKGCRSTSNAQYAYYKQPSMKYIYRSENAYPDELQKRKTFGTVHLDFEAYEAYGAGYLPQQLHYQDGGLQLTLTLLSVKK